MGQTTTCHDKKRRIYKDAAKEEWKKLIAQGLRRTEEDWTKLRE